MHELTVFRSSGSASPSATGRASKSDTSTEILARTFHDGKELEKTLCSCSHGRLNTLFWDPAVAETEGLVDGCERGRGRVAGYLEGCLCWNSCLVGCLIERGCIDMGTFFLDGSECRDGCGDGRVGGVIK